MTIKYNHPQADVFGLTQAGKTTRHPGYSDNHLSRNNTAQTAVIYLLSRQRGY